MTAHPRRMYKECKDCRAPGTPGDGLSMRGLCIDCSIERQRQSSMQMAEKRGPHFERWQESILDLAAEVLRDRQVSA